MGTKNKNEKIRRCCLRKRNIWTCLHQTNQQYTVEHKKLSNLNHILFNS